MYFINFLIIPTSWKKSIGALNHLLHHEKSTVCLFLNKTKSVEINILQQEYSIRFTLSVRAQCAQSRFSHRDASQRTISEVASSIFLTASGLKNCSVVVVAVVVLVVVLVVQFF